MIDWGDIDRFKFSDENTSANNLMARISIKKSSRESIKRESIDIVRRARAMTAKKG